MLLKDKLRQESVVALKAGDKKKVEVLRFLVSLLVKKEMQLPAGKMKKTDEVTVMRKELKNKQESRQMFAEAKRDELVEQMDYEIEVLGAYLPKQMEKDAVRKIVDEVLAEMDGSAFRKAESKQNVNFGQIMGKVMAKTGGKADGSLVAQVVKEKISG